MCEILKNLENNEEILREMPLTLARQNLGQCEQKQLKQNLIKNVYISRSKKCVECHRL